MIVDNLFPHVTLGLNMYGWKLTEVLCHNKLQAQTLYFLSVVTLIHFFRHNFDTLCSEFEI